MRTKKIYSNHQKRGGTSPVATDSGCPAGRNKKDYHRSCVAFHGGDMAFEAYVKGGRRGYGARQ